MDYDFSDFNLRELTLVLEAVTERMAEFDVSGDNIRDKFGLIGDRVSHPDYGFGLIRGIERETETITVKFDNDPVLKYCELDDLVNKDA